MGYRLIADAGSTKIDWTAIDKEGNVVSSVTCGGVNVAVTDPGILSDVLSDISKDMDLDGEIDEIYYYGAGCATPSLCKAIEAALMSVWNSSAISVESDMIGAAHALMGSSSGIACILGTGSNSCLYENGVITDHTPSLGYILGDEGSGAAIGRRLLNRIFKRTLPREIIENFTDKYRLTLEGLIDNVYRGRQPNRYLASFMPFVSENIEEPEISLMVKDEFANFIKNNLLRYSVKGIFPVGAVGSIAAVFKNQLHEVMHEMGFELTVVDRSPMPGLIKYHTTYT